MILCICERIVCELFEGKAVSGGGGWGGGVVDCRIVSWLGVCVRGICLDFHRLNDIIMCLRLHRKSLWHSETFPENTSSTNPSK
jgi:hypothetical protein